MIFTESRIFVIPAWNAEENGYVLCLSGKNILSNIPQGGEQGLNQSKAVKSKCSYLCKSTQDSLCLHRLEKHTYLLLTTCLGFNGASDRDSDKLTKHNVSRRYHFFFGYVFGFEGSLGISSIGYIALPSAPHSLLYTHRRKVQQIEFAKAIN